MSALKLLKERLAAAQKVAAGQPGRIFVAETELNDIFTRECLQGVLGCPEFHIPLLRQEDIRNIVSKKFRRILCMLVQLGHEGWLSDLVERRISDGKLPVSKQELQDLLPEFHEPFYRLQWSYCALYLSRDDFEQRLPPEVVLPFLYEEEIGSGGFGVVYKVKVHKDYQDYFEISGTEVSGS
jgi:hypothetical protein